MSPYRVWGLSTYVTCHARFMCNLYYPTHKSLKAWISYIRNCHLIFIIDTLIRLHCLANLAL